MYYRNANCAVVVYDITQAVGFANPLQFIYDQSLTLESILVFPRQGKSVGERAPATSEREHHHCACWKQARSRYGIPRQARNPPIRRRTVRKGSRSSILRDIREDRRERQRPLHRNRQEATSRSGWPQRHAIRPPPWRRLKARGKLSSIAKRVPMLDLLTHLVFWHAGVKALEGKGAWRNTVLVNMRLGACIIRHVCFTLNGK